MRKSTTYGDEICLQAIHELFKVIIVLHQARGQRKRRYENDQTSDWPVIHLGFEDAHYYALFPLADDPAGKEEMRHQLTGKRFISSSQYVCQVNNNDFCCTVMPYLVLSGEFPYAQES